MPENVVHCSREFMLAECGGDRKEHSDKAEHTNERHGMESRVDGNEIDPFQGPKKVQGCQEV